MCVEGRRFYDSQFEPVTQSPGSHQQPRPGPIIRGRSAGDLVRPAYIPGSSERDQPMYTYRPGPTPFGYERTVNERPVCIIFGFCDVMLSFVCSVNCCFSLFL